MNRIFFFLGLLSSVSMARTQEPLPIGVIDFYGLRTISEERIRTALPFTEGDLISPDLPFDEIEVEMADALKVSRIALEPSCCPEPNVAILYVGVEETATAAVRYLPEPTGEETLPVEILDTARALDGAQMAAIWAGDSEEDWSAGHALAVNPDVRALQERYIDYADEYREQLLTVLHGSARQRALAAWVLGYAADKRAIVPHLERAVLDANEGVRNNAARALTLIATYANQHPELEIQINPDVFIDMLNSFVFTDRNKATAVLWPLTESRDPELLARIRDKALPSLIEMCRWKAEGQAFMPCLILERVIGLPEQETLHPKEMTIAMAAELLPREARTRNE